MRPTAFVLRTAASALSRPEIANELAIINRLLPKVHWLANINEETSELRGHYKMKNFAKTWEFLNMIALHAQKLRHHPTITTTYNVVDLIITTHDAQNQVTQLDIKLAQAIQNSYVDSIVERANIGILVPDTTSSKASKIIDELTKKNKKT